MLARLLEQRLHGMKARDLLLLPETDYPESAPALDSEGSSEDDTAFISSLSSEIFLTSRLARGTPLVSDPEDNRKKIFEPSTAEKQSGKERMPNRSLGLQDREMDRKAKTQPKLPITDPEADDRRMAVTENAWEILLPFPIREEERDQEKDRIDSQTVIRFLTTTDPFLVLVEKLRRKLQSQLIIPPLSPPEILNGNQRGRRS